MAIRCIRSYAVWQLAVEKRKHGVCVSNRGGHRRAISAIGDVQFRSDVICRDASHISETREYRTSSSCRAAIRQSESASIWAPLKSIFNY